MYVCSVLLSVFLGAVLPVCAMNKVTITNSLSEIFALSIGLPHAMNEKEIGQDLSETGMILKNAIVNGSYLKAISVRDKEVESLGNCEFKKLISLAQQKHESERQSKSASKANKLIFKKLHREMMRRKRMEDKQRLKNAELFEALYGQDLQKMKLLIIRSGAQVDCCDEFDRTLLYKAEDLVLLFARNRFGDWQNQVINMKEIIKFLKMVREF